MKPQRRFSREFKRQVVEELLRGVSTPAQLMRRHEISSGLFYHRKRQYAAHDYVDILLEQGFRISMARKGNPYDNAMAESFMKTLKTKEVYLWEYWTLADASCLINKCYRRTSDVRERCLIKDVTRICC